MDQAGEQFAEAGHQAGAGGGGGLVDGLMSKGAALKAGLAGLAVAAGAVLMDGISQALDQQKTVSKLQAQLGLTGPVAKNAGDVAGKLYASGVSENFQEATDAIKSVMQDGILPPDASNDQLQKIATKAQDVSKVFDQDLGGVTKAVSQMMRTGLVSSADEAFDVITKGMQTGADKGGDLLDTFNEYGTQFRKLGVDGPQAMGLISQAIKAGARDSDLAADALKEFSIRAVDGSETTAQGFEAIGLNAEDMAKRIGSGGATANAALSETLQKLKAMPDPVARSQAAVMLFGTQAEDLGDALYAMDPANAVAALGEVGGAADKMGSTLRDNASTRIETFKRTLEEGFVNLIGNYVLPIVERFANVLSTILGPAIDWIKGVFGGMFSDVEQKSGTMNTIRDTISSTTDTIHGAFDKVVTIVRDQVIPWFESMWPRIEPVVTKLKETIAVGFQYIQTVVETVVKVLDYIWSNWGDNILRVASGMVTQVMGVIGGFLDVLKGIWEFAIGLLTGNWGKMWQGIKDIASGIVGALVGIVKGCFEMVYGAFKGPIDNMVSGFNDAVNWIKSGWQNVKNWFSNNLSFNFGGMWDGIYDTFKGAVNRIIRAWNNLSFTVGGGSVFGMDIPSYTISTPNIPYLALGGNVTAGGAAIVGDAGPELLQLPAGARVTPLLGSQRATPGDSSGSQVIVNVTVQGSVTAERDLARSIASSVRDEIIRIGKRNGGRTGF
ncbi:phage tail tape measure protein [Kitasatospora sp. NPDC001309]|uniref:phage tail tape measure protein n=1 Tax=Kitasatospora sp. NPDC001309 TaxID=3364013 RepID=UPI0036A40CBF